MSEWKSYVITSDQLAALMEHLVYDEFGEAAALAVSLPEVRKVPRIAAEGDELWDEVVS